MAGPRGVGPGVIFDYEELKGPHVLEGLRAAARLSVLAVKGLIADAENNLVSDSDLDLIHDLADLVDQYAHAVDRRQLDGLGKDGA